MQMRKTRNVSGMSAVEIITTLFNDGFNSRESIMNELRNIQIASDDNMQDTVSEAWTLVYRSYPHLDEHIAKYGTIENYQW